MTHVEQTQILLLNQRRTYSILAMLSAAVLLYGLLGSQVDSVLFSYWIVTVLIVDAFRLFAAISFTRAKTNGSINYQLENRNLLIGTVLSGACWGGLSIILMPVLDSQSIVLVLLLLLALVTGSILNLAYQFRLSVVFVLLVIVPLMLSLPIQDYIVDFQLYVLEAMVLLITVFLLSISKIIYDSHTENMTLSEYSHQHDQELLIQREKSDVTNREKSEFLANMSHELRTPMHAILGFSSLGTAKIETATNEKISSYFTRINESGQLLLDLLNDLLDLSKLEAGRMEFEFSENDLQATVSSVVEELNPAFQKNLLTIDIEPTSLNTLLVYDDEKISQAITNLLLNAIKFSAEGRNMMICFSDATLNSAKPDHADVAALSVSICDQGAGVPDDELETIFDQFVQSSKTENGAGGTGLGLSISREIIKRHGGVIKAGNASANSGVVFTLSLPYQQS